MNKREENVRKADCKYCGEEMEVGTLIVLTSYPPQYQAYCEHCGEKNYVWEDELKLKT